MQNEYHSSYDENSQYFCESLDCEQDSMKEDKNNIVEPGLNFHNIEQLNVACPTESNLEKQPSESVPEKGKKSKSKVERSIFHNFQKHLVITLRQVIKVKKSTSKNGPESLASEMWEIFSKQTRIFTKNILHVVFGVVDYEGSDMKNLYDEEMMKNFGFGDIFNKNSESLVEEAQSYLRSETVRQLNKLNMKEFLKTRRISQRQEFIEYVKEFVSELEEGPMRKRLPKNKKADMKLRKDIYAK